MWLMYINDLSGVLRLHDVAHTMYADDIAILAGHKDPAKCASRLQAAIGD
jgi:hypothetical protein